VSSTAVFTLPFAWLLGLSTLGRKWRHAWAGHCLAQTQTCDLVHYDVHALTSPSVPSVQVTCTVTGMGSVAVVLDGLAVHTTSVEQVFVRV
jgi:hypothetical protein